MIRIWIRRATALLNRMAQHWKLALLLPALLLVFSAQGPAPASMDAQISRELAQDRFDFVAWELRALWQKLTHGLVAPQRFMTEVDRSDLVLGYLSLLAETHRVEADIHRIYVDPSVDDPKAATAELRATEQKMRRELNLRQPIVEAILEEQVASILHEEGFGTLGQEFPPVAIHFTPLPQLLVVSSRHYIDTLYQLSLTHGLGVAEAEAIEEAIEETHDVSSLVTGIGGLASYPAMLLETSSINWIAEVAAHEWTHHYLFPRPLGREYFASAETRAINETVATIVGQEAGQKVVARYYPDHLPPPQPEEQVEDEPPEEPPREPPGFDYRMEMRKTRIRVDELLAEGNIEEAEAYMESRRQVFVEQGYPIRKLNQAYFAFHGAYAAHPGAAGDDPIGPAVRELFTRSPDLRAFVRHIAGVTTLSELERVLEGQLPVPIDHSP